MFQAVNHRILVIGIGNEFRGDDAAGLCAARGLHRDAGGAFAVLEHTGDCSDLMHLWKNSAKVIVIDAVHSGRIPGTIVRLDACRQTIPPDSMSFSTHVFGLMQAVELSRALELLPQELIVYGIEGARFEIGRGLSPAVAAAIARVQENILAEILPHFIRAA
jgi:hydrogenase maturation protease